MVIQVQFETVLKYIEIGKETGKIELGGEPNDIKNGSLTVSPVIFLNQPEDSRIMKEEVFGPGTSHSQIPLPLNIRSTTNTLTHPFPSRNNQHLQNRSRSYRQSQRHRIRPLRLSLHQRPHACYPREQAVGDGHGWRELRVADGVLGSSLWWLEG